MREDCEERQHSEIRKLEPEERPELLLQGKGLQNSGWKERIRSIQLSEKSESLHYVQLLKTADPGKPSERGPSGVFLYYREAGPY